MILRVGLSLVLITLFINFGQATRSDLIAVFPNTFRPGSPLIVTCNLVQSGQVTVNLTLARNGVNVLQNTSVITYGQQNSVRINVPPSLTYSDISMAKLSYNGGSIWSPIKYDPVTCLVFIQTDRGMYAEKEEVKLRIIVLLPSLRPFKGKFNVELFDGKNKTVQQWLDVSGTRGVYSKRFTIPRHSNKGFWRVVVESMKRKTEKEFEVRKYIIPKFKVHLSCPDFFTRTTRNLRCTVKARYFFGKSVTGVIHIQFVTRIKNIDLFLCDDYTEIAGEFSKSTLLNSSTILYENDIDVVAKVSDPSTGTTVVNSVVVKLKRAEAMKWTLEPKRSSFQPDLPFVTFLKFKSLKTSNMPVTIEVINRKVDTCFNVFNYIRVTKSIISRSVTVDNEGFGKLSLTLSPHASEINIKTYNGADKAVETLHVSKSNRGLTILPHRPYSMVGGISTFDIFTKTRVTGPLWYIISSRGTEINKGQCGQGTHSKFKCMIKIEPSFYPGFQLLFYHASKNGSFSEDSIFIEVMGNPTNNFVSISKDKTSSYLPGEQVKLTVKSTRNSVVYLLTIDEGIHQSQHGFDLNIDNVNSALTGIIGEHQAITLKGGKPSVMDLPNYTSVCPDLCAISPCKNGGTCVMTSISRYICKCAIHYEGTNCEKNSYVGSGKIFWIDKGKNKQIFNILNAPNRPFPSRYMIPRPPSTSRLSNINSNPVRRIFPRTWIWEEVHMRGQNVVSFTKKVPDTLTTWTTTAFCVNDENGLGILHDRNTLKMQVFRSFFIKLKNPSNIIAGNSAAVQISLFNYNPIPKMVLLYIWFQDYFGASFITVNQHSSKMEISAVNTSLNKFGLHNITIAAYDVAGYSVLDIVEIPIFVKAPGVPQDYNIPKIISLNGKTSWVRESINITMPQFALTESKSLFIAITGDILAPSINGLGHLIRSPCGCGEQTMMFLAPNIYVLHYLKSTHQLSQGMKRAAITNINIGIDNELRWRRHDGSFSVWGNSDSHGSTWLTSFVLMCFHQADHFVPVENNIFKKGLNWLLKQQNVDGSFPENGRVIHYQMQGGVRASRVTMTAYVLLALLEFKDNSKLGTKLQIATAKNKAARFITRSSSINELQGSKHGMALTSYVLQKAGYFQKARFLYADLKRKANSDGQHLFWQNQGNTVYKQKLGWQSPNPRARPVDIETSAYALLYLAEKKDMSQGMKIVHWLVSQRNPQGGFGSTQDTVVSLHALSRFSSLLQQSGMDVEVKLKTEFTEKTVKVNSNNKLLVQRVELDKQTKHVEIKARGKGFVLVDTTVKYNVMKSGDSAFEINTNITSSQHTIDKITVHVCIRRKDNKDNGMVIAEVGLPCGFKGDTSKTNARGLDHKETTSDAMVMYFKNLKRSWVCFDVTSNRVDKVTESQGVPIIVYDYYEPDNYGISSYMTGKLNEMNICQICQECNICKQIFLG